MRGVVAFAFTLAFLTPAHSHDYKHPERQQWYESLHSRNGGLCCDGKEAVHVAAEQWDERCEVNAMGERICHYRVFLHNRWNEVPPTSIVDGPNLDGEALVWEVPMWRGNEVVSTTIRCFMPGAQG